MGLFSNQFSNVIEWEEFRDDMLFWKWDNKEIKKKDTFFILHPDEIFQENLFYMFQIYFHLWQP